MKSSTPPPVYWTAVLNFGIVKNFRRPGKWCSRISERCFPSSYRAILLFQWSRIFIFIQNQILHILIQHGLLSMSSFTKIHDNYIWYCLQYWTLDLNNRLFYVIFFSNEIWFAMLWSSLRKTKKQYHTYWPAIFLKLHYFSPFIQYSSIKFHGFLVLGMFGLRDRWRQ